MLANVSACAPAGIILGAVGIFFGRPGLAFLLMLGWCLFAAAVSVPLLAAVAPLVGDRRENLALVAQGR